MKEVDRAPQKLFVYECWGLGFPRNEPRCGGFLGIWPEPPFHYLFFDRPAMPLVKRWLDTVEGWMLKATYELDYSQWQQTCAQDCRVGPFLIRTESDRESASTSAGDIVMQLNPGVVFGSGLHASTRGCLLAIAWLFDHFCPQRVIDLGTGTGILALACALLGAPQVWAVDCNPLAVRVAQRNFQANGVQRQVSLLVAQELRVFKEPSDLLIMNLEWPCLRRVLQGQEWLGYRWVILSGLLNTQWRELEPLIPPAYHVESREILDDWVTAIVSSA